MPNEHLANPAFTRRVLDSLFAFVGVLEVDGTLMEANQAPLDIAGLHIDDVRGRKFWDCYWWNYSEAMRAHIREACISAAAGESVRFETPVRVAGGKFITIDFQLVPLRDELGVITHLIPSAVDITSRVRADDDRRRLVELVEHSSDFISHCDAEGKLTYMNAAGRRMVGLPEHGDLTGISIDSYVAPEWRERFRHEILPTMQRTGHWHGEMKLRNIKTGELIDVSRDSFILCDPATGEKIGMGTVTRDVTAANKAEQALRESEERFRATFENAAIGIAHVGLDGRWLRVNDRLCQIVGYDRAELQTKTFADITLPEDVQADVELSQKLFRGEIKTYSMEKRHVRKDGRVVPALLTASMVRSPEGEPRYYIAVVDDITERWATEEALRESEERFRAMADNLPQLAWMADETGWISWYNRRWFEYTGTTLEQMQGWGWQAIHHPDYVQATTEKFRRHVAAGQFWEDTFPIRGRDGQFRWFLSRAYPVRDESGRITRWFGTNTDITEQRQIEADLQSLTAELEQRVKERTALAEQRAQQLRDLAIELTRSEERERRRLAYALHENLQQVLVAAKMELSRVQRRVDKPDMLARSLQTLDEAINISRNLTAELSPPVLYDGTFDMALDWLARRMFERLRLKVRVESPGDGVAVPLDTRIFLFQAAQELLLNVAKHAGVSEATVRFSRGPAGDFQLAVHDAGAGFMPNPTGKSGSFGLFSLKERCEALGGTVEIESAPGRGSTVTLWLPAAATDAKPAPAPAAPPAPHTAADGRVRVIIVDDHALVRVGVRSALQEYADIDIVAEAASGAEALRLAAQTRPHVVLMDVSMPGMSGIEATQQLKATHPEITVVGLTMHDDPMIHAAMLRAGAAQVVTKSGSLSSLIHWLRELKQPAGAAANAS